MNRIKLFRESAFRILLLVLFLVPLQTPTPFFLSSTRFCRVALLTWAPPATFCISPKLVVSAKDTKIFICTSYWFFPEAQRANKHKHEVKALLMACVFNWDNLSTLKLASKALCYFWDDLPGTVVPVAQETASCPLLSAYISQLCSDTFWPLCSSADTPAKAVQTKAVMAGGNTQQEFPPRNCSFSSQDHWRNHS